MELRSSGRVTLTMLVSLCVRTRTQADVFLVGLTDMRPDTDHSHVFSLWCKAGTDSVGYSET